MTFRDVLNWLLDVRVTHFLCLIGVPTAYSLWRFLKR